MTQANDQQGRVRRPARRFNNAPPTQQLPRIPTPLEKPKVGIQAIKELLHAKRDSIARVINPRSGLTVDGLIQNALQSLLRDKRLTMALPYSILDSVMAAARLGLDFMADLAWIVPFEKKHRDSEGNEMHEAWYGVFYAGYKGLITVAARAGFLLDCHEVRAQDQIEVLKGTSNTINHRIAFGNRGEMIGVYCVARDRDGRTVHIETMDMSEVAAIRQGAQTQVVWDAHPQEMSKKTVCRRAFKWLPRDNGDVRLLAELDSRAEEGQQITDLVNQNGQTNPQQQQAMVPQAVLSVDPSEVI